MKIFPAIDLYDGKAVRLYKGDYNKMTVYSENPIEIALEFEKKGAKFIHIVDLEGARDGTTPNIEIVKQIAVGGSSKKHSRVPRFIDSINHKAGRMVCDHEQIYIQNRNNPDAYECAAILATHTGNTSVYSFAAEVLFHARFLVALAKIKIPFLGKSIYGSAIRADLSIGDTELQGYTPYYRENSCIVKEQYRCHTDKEHVENIIARYCL